MERRKVGSGIDVDTETDMTSALAEKLKEASLGESKRQAANRPQTLSVSYSPDLFINGVVAGSVAGGP
jgi:hypothetical protein